MPHENLGFTLPSLACATKKRKKKRFFTFRFFLQLGYIERLSACARVYWVVCVSGGVGCETCPLAAAHTHYFREISAEPRIFFFLSDSQQEVNWKGDNSWLFSPPIDPQIGEAHLNSCVSSIQFLNLAPLPTSSLVSEK